MGGGHYSRGLQCAAGVEGLLDVGLRSVLEQHVAEGDGVVAAAHHQGVGGRGGGEVSGANRLGYVMEKNVTKTATTYMIITLQIL